MFEDSICKRVDLLEKLGTQDCPHLIYEFKYSFFVLLEQQFYKGHSLLLLKRHVRELHELPEDEYLELSKELYIANGAIFKTFRPWKMNNQSLGNQDQHVHWHIIPRYESDKYHKSLPMTDVIKGEIALGDYTVSDDEARKTALEIRKNIQE